MDLESEGDKEKERVLERERQRMRKRERERERAKLNTFVMKRAFLITFWGPFGLSMFAFLTNL